MKASTAASGAAAGAPSASAAPLLMLDESKREQWRSGGGYRKLTRRLRAHYDVQM